MAWANPFFAFGQGELFDTLLPDFLLAFTFFAAMTYGILSRRFDRQRPAAAMSAALGLALAVGLVWWEHTNNWTIRDLGPLAVGFAIFALAAVLFQSLRNIGGSVSGAGAALVGALLVGWGLGIDWPGGPELFGSLVTLSLILAIVGFLLHRSAGRPAPRLASSPAAGRVSFWPDAEDWGRDRRVSDGLRSQFEHLRRESDWLGRRQGVGQDLSRQLDRMLPAEGWLTERLAKLREKAHHMSKGEIGRLHALQGQVRRLPPKARKSACERARSEYHQLKLDQRLERLDRAVAETERRIGAITRLAKASIERRDYRKVPDLLDDARKLQKHNSKLITQIERTEEKLVRLAREAAKSNRRG